MEKGSQGVIPSRNTENTPERSRHEASFFAGFCNTAGAERGIADRFHFPGFQKGKQVYEAYKNSDVFVMPSVSEPFGIAPLEAMQCGTPSIISKQSGCGEILTNVIKVDYWDINAMADAIYSICTNPSLFKYLQEEGIKEVDQITWEKVGLRHRAIYDELIRKNK